ncbi:hypothetical protein [Peribacillus simplex]|uniref:hypothetical protein n=1 Tax=Peribacillus simplex TaxID=1478 RepID=UPI001629920D|nr:hypothetical protein [Peribacillus simplex]
MVVKGVPKIGKNGKISTVQLSLIVMTAVGLKNHVTIRLIYCQVQNGTDGFPYCLLLG